MLEQLQAGNQEFKPNFSKATYEDKITNRITRTKTGDKMVISAEKAKGIWRLCLYACEYFGKLGKNFRNLMRNF